MTDLLAAALAGAAVCFALVRSIASAALVDATRKQAKEIENRLDRHDARFASLEETAHRDSQKLEGVCRSVGYKHGAKQ